MNIRPFNIPWIVLALAASLVADPSQAAPGVLDAESVRHDAARHVYESYPQFVRQGQLPAQIHAVALVELTLDSSGQLRDLNLLREPPEMPHAAALIRDMVYRISPFPIVACCGPDLVTFSEVWIFDDNGQLQLGALTEGPSRADPGRDRMRSE